MLYSAKESKQDKKKERETKKIRMFLVIAAGFLFFMAIVSLLKEGGILKVWRLERELQTLNEKAASLRVENKRLETMVMDLKDHDSHVDRVAREELGLVKSGETVYKFIHPPANTTPSSPSR